jgi:cytoskeletal protein RodZ
MNATWKRVAVIIAVFIPVAIVGAFVMKQDNDDFVVTDSVTPVVTTPLTTTPTATTTTPATATTTPATTATTPAAATTSYTNGTYTAVGQYRAPDGQQAITVTLTVSGDVVTAATVAPGATGEDSAAWQAKFIKGVQVQVVGKKLASLHLTNVSGSSLTPVGFNAAVSDIQNQAKS